MKVIKSSKVVKSENSKVIHWTKELSCSHCGAVLLVSNQDLFEKDRGLFRRSLIGFTCPECYAITEVKGITFKCRSYGYDL